MGEIDGYTAVLNSHKILTIGTASTQNKSDV